MGLPSWNSFASSIGLTSFLPSLENASHPKVLTSWSQRHPGVRYLHQRQRECSWEKQNSKNLAFNCTALLIAKLYPQLPIERSFFLKHAHCTGTFVNPTPFPLSPVHHPHHTPSIVVERSQGNNEDHVGRSSHTQQVVAGRMKPSNGGKRYVLEARSFEYTAGRRKTNPTCCFAFVLALSTFFCDLPSPFPGSVCPPSCQMHFLSLLSKGRIRSKIPISDCPFPSIISLRSIVVCSERFPCVDDSIRFDSSC